MTRAVPSPNLPNAACHGMADQWTTWEAATLHELRYNNTLRRSHYHRELAALDVARDALTICGTCTSRTECWQWARAEGYDGIAGGTIRYRGETVTADPRAAERPDRTPRLPPPDDLHWLIRQGMDTRRIAHRYGVTRSAVHKALTRDGGAA